MNALFQKVRCGCLRQIQKQVFSGCDSRDEQWPKSESVKFNHDVAMTRDVLKHTQQWKESGGWALPRSGITHVLVCRIYTFLFCLDQVCVMQILYLTKTYEIFKKAKSALKILVAI